ncbi:hypothetical protein P3568_16105 [Vibrio parahaemolyticus]|nr:hypothetical protein [Vibrio parahaemolyticus]HCK0614473.1 hypothetical protein [Vibrio parahaemolyticus]
MAVLIAAGLTFASGVISNIMASKDAEEYNEAMRDANVVNLMYKNRGMNQQLAAMEDSYAVKKTTTKIQMAQQQSAAKTAGADSGGGGNSLNSIVGSFETALGQQLATLEDNLAKTRAQTQSSKDGAQWSTQSAIQQQAHDTSVDILTPALNAANTYLMGAAAEKEADKAVNAMNNALRIGGN